MQVVIAAGSSNAYDTFGNGYGSKWGTDPNAGTGAIITWGYMQDGTTLDPVGFPAPYVIGASNITALRNSVDVNYGVGAFDTAIQNAFNTWSAVANITFVGPVVDNGLPVGSENAISPHVRIGAFNWTEPGGAIGYGPPGPWGPDYFPLSGDIIFNLSGLGIQRPFQIAPGEEDVDSVDVFNYGDDVEGLFLHELGHAVIGLDHPRWAGENPDRRVMYVGDDQAPGAPFCCTAINRQLHADDIAAAQYVYGIRGDYDRSGQVEAADYVLWRNSHNESVTPGTAADGNLDGQVTTADYDLWRTNFGQATVAGFGEQPSFAAAAAIPEPHSILLFVAAAIALVSTQMTKR